MSLAKRGPADVGVAEEAAAGGAIGRDCFLVAERDGSEVLRGDHWGHPRRLDAGRRGGDVVGAGHRDRLYTLDRGAVGEVGGETGVVQPRAVRPREPVRPWARAEGERRVAVTDDPLF